MNTPLIDRVMARVTVDETTGCWIWNGYRTEDGYGRIKRGGRGPNLPVHHATYTHHVGPIPEGLEIDHLCRVRACCNPEHLEAVPHSENRRRQAATITHCPKGHSYDGENTYVSPKGGRVCRTCAAERARERRESGVDREKRKAYMVEYRERTREQRKAYMAEYRKRQA